MTTEPKLLTEADIDRFGTMSREAVTAELRERGLIAEAPIEPLLKEARERVAYRDLNPEYREAVLRGDHDDRHAVKIEHAALLRGREIGLAERPTLTLEMVEEMASLVFGATYQEVYCDRVPEGDKPYLKAFARHFHTALLERLP